MTNGISNFSCGIPRPPPRVGSIKTTTALTTPLGMGATCDPVQGVINLETILTTQGRKASGRGSKGGGW